jgi:metal-responsive CopG/Arc/MetJ family transcriptional regulator
MVPVAGRLNPLGEKENRFVSVSIPADIIEQIDRVIASQRLGYDSRPEFIKDAVRRRLEEITRAYIHIDPLSG